MSEARAPGGTGYGVSITSHLKMEMGCLARCVEIRYAQRALVNKTISKLDWVKYLNTVKSGIVFIGRERDDSDAIGRNASMARRVENVTCARLWSCSRPAASSSRHSSTDHHGSAEHHFCTAYSANI